MAFQALDMSRQKKHPQPDIDSGNLAVEPPKPNNRRRKKNTRAAELTTFEKYEIVEVHRSELKNAPYNPRRISAKAKEKLRKNISKVGLLDPIIWNRVTGNIVGGHQRVAALDTLEGSRNYKLRVAAVELDPATEKSQNVFLNNEEAQGEWDIEKLESLFQDKSVSFEDAGYSVADMYQMFGDNPLLERPDDLVEMATKIRAMKENYEAIKAKVETGVRAETDYYAVVVFESNADREEFTDALGLKDNCYIDGRELWAVLHANHYITPDGEPAESERHAKDETDEQESAAPPVRSCRMDILDCPRCAGTHLQMVVYELKNAETDENCWAFCPAECQPFFVEATPNP